MGSHPFHPDNFGLPMPFCSRVRSRHATDGQTDTRADRHCTSFYNAPSYEGLGHNNTVKLTLHYITFSVTVSWRLSMFGFKISSRFDLGSLLKVFWLFLLQLIEVALSTWAYSAVDDRATYTAEWRQYLSTELVGKINALFRRLKRFGYLSCSITVSDLMTDSDTGLFRKMYSPSHCLHHMLPCPRMCDNLRDRGHYQRNCCFGIIINILHCFAQKVLYHACIV